MPSRRRRLDIELVRRRLVSSRAEAQRAVVAGKVTVGGSLALKPARLVDPGDAIVVTGDEQRFVSRGAHKLAAALDGFGIDVTGARVVDVGSSTGGFTDCVLRRGAASVVAIDVGTNQLHERLRADPRVSVHERTDVREVAPADVGAAGDLVVADLSFISLRLVVDAIVGLARRDGDLVLLVKPQFEAGRREADRARGVIRDPEIWSRTLREALSALEAAGAAIMGVMTSPITGGDGNVEFLAHAVAPGSPAAGSDWRGWVEAAVSHAVERCEQKGR